MTALGALYRNLAFARFTGKSGWTCFQSSESACAWILDLRLSSPPSHSDQHWHPVARWAAQELSLPETMSSGTYSSAFLSLFIHIFKFISFHLGEKKHHKMANRIFSLWKPQRSSSFKHFHPKAKMFCSLCFFKNISIISIKPFSQWSGEGGKRALMGNKSC